MRKCRKHKRRKKRFTRTKSIDFFREYVYISLCDECMIAASSDLTDPDRNPSVAVVVQLLPDHQYYGYVKIGRKLLRIYEYSELTPELYVLWRDTRKSKVDKRFIRFAKKIGDL